MIAVTYSGNGKIEVKDLPVPEIKKNEILLRVKASSICATDIKIKNFGHFKNPQGKEIILGHEVAGIIDKVGSDIKAYHEGMRISIAPNVGCGICNQCISGYKNYCEEYDAIGISIDGSFAEYMKIPFEFIMQGNIVELPANVYFEEASLAEPLSTVICAAEAVNISPPDIVLVVGAGPMGILHLMMAKLRGANKVIISEISKIRRDQARSFGADIVVNPLEDNLKDIVFSESKGLGADVIIIAAPSGKAQEDSLDLIARRGRINFFGGLAKGQDIINMKSNIIHYKNVLLTGTTGQSVHQYRKAIEIVSSNRIALKRVISAKYKLKDAVEAFDKAVLEETLKVVFSI